VLSCIEIEWFVGSRKASRLPIHFVKRILQSAFSPAVCIDLRRSLSSFKFTRTFASKFLFSSTNSDSAISFSIDSWDCEVTFAAINSGDLVSSLWSDFRVRPTFLSLSKSWGRLGLSALEGEDSGTSRPSSSGDPSGLPSVSALSASSLSLLAAASYCGPVVRTGACQEARGQVAGKSVGHACHHHHQRCVHGHWLPLCHYSYRILCSPVISTGSNHRDHVKVV